MALNFSLPKEAQEQIGENNLRLLQEAYNHYFESGNAVVEIELVDQASIQKLNKEHRQLDEATDVLSFPLFANLEAIKAEIHPAELLLGTIVICPEKAALYNESLPQLVHHGLLHLLGFDHETNFEAWYTEEAKILHSLEEKHLIIPAVTHD